MVAVNGTKKRRFERDDNGVTRCWKFNRLSSLVFSRAIPLNGCFAISFAGIFFAIAASVDCVLAQITPDSILGTESSVVTPNVFINGLRSDRIDGGAIRGTNLFHSFLEFQINEGQRVYFSNPAGIENIFSQVTGNNASTISGRLGVLGNANLFLLNPNGIIFGSNASLDIGGSFLGSTASSLNFADGTQFSTIASQTPPLLTISVPLGLQYGGNPGTIQVQKSKLTMPNGKILALVGGNVQLKDAFLQVPGGRVELGGVAGSGTIGLEIDNSSLRLNVPQGLVRTDISLDGTTIDVVAGSGGSIKIYGQNLTFKNSLVRSGSEQFPGGGNTGGNFPGGGNTGGNNSSSGNTGDNNGNITPIGVGGVTLVGAHSGLLANTDPNSTDNGGNIFISFNRRIVLDGAYITVDSQGTGKGGNIQIQAEAMTLYNHAAISAETASNAGGNIALQVQDLLLMRHGSRISTTAGTAQAGGDGGNITIGAQFIIAVPEENSDITANAFTGRGGNINITTQGIYGLEFRPRLTPLSDITASSQFGVNGTVQINTPDVDPSRGLVNLPSEPVTVEVAQDCQAAGKQKTIEFFNTGRGGLAPNPYEPLSTNSIWEDVLSPTQRTTNSASTSASSATSPNKIVEAQAWIINEKGEVVLVKQMPAIYSQRPCRLR